MCHTGAACVHDRRGKRVRRHAQPARIAPMTHEDALLQAATAGPPTSLLDYF